MSDLETDHTVDYDPSGKRERKVEVRAYRERKFKDLSGEEKLKRETEHTVELPADPDTAEAIAKEILTYVAERSESGPPEGKPLHQQYAEAEPDP